MTILFNSLTPTISAITLNRPEKRNALNIQLLEDFLIVLSEIENNPKNRIVIIQGAGPVFCAGMDLLEISDPETAHYTSLKIAQILTRLYETPLITIAAVHGAAIAGGAGLMTACDLALAAENTQIGYPETRRGLIAAQVMTFLHRQLRQKEWKELLLTGESIEATRALHIGLINRVVPYQNLLEETMKIAHTILKGAPEATKQTKKLIDNLYPISFENELNFLLKEHQKARSSEEAAEGIKAFLEKREPNWI